MKQLTEAAREVLAGYLGRLRERLHRVVRVDVEEVEADVVRHIEDALRGTHEPVRARALRAVLDRLGQPAEWALEDGGAAPLACGRPALESAFLAYLSFSLFLCAGLTCGPYGTGAALVALLGSFVAARAAIDRTDTGAPRSWLLVPALSVAYTLLAAGLLFWIFLPMGALACEIARLESIAPRFPALVVNISARLVDLLEHRQDPSKLARLLASSGPWVFGPLGLWWTLLGALSAAAPRRLEAAFRPVLEGRGRTVAALLLAAGAASLALAAALTLLKHLDF